MTHSKIFHVEQQVHPRDKHLLFLGSHNLPDHETGSLEMLYLNCALVQFFIDFNLTSHLVF